MQGLKVRYIEIDITKYRLPSWCDGFNVENILYWIIHHRWGSEVDWQGRSDCCCLVRRVVVTPEWWLWSNFWEEAHRLLENIALPPLLLSFSPGETILFLSRPGETHLLLTPQRRGELRERDVERIVSHHQSIPRILICDNTNVTMCENEN